MNKPSTLWKIIILFIAIFIGSILVDSWIIEPDRIEVACNKISTETTTSDVVLIAKKNNLRLTESRSINKNQNIITLHGGSFNKHICEIVHDGNNIIASEFKIVSFR